MAHSFNVYGPYKIPVKTIKAKKPYFEIEQKDALNDFWEKCNMADKKGCNVFVNIVAASSTPIYVGKTNNSFKNEIFTPHKRVLLNKFLNTAFKKGLHVFFISSDSKADLTTTIEEIETYLIIQAKRANENLLNEKKTTPKWSITGIYGESKIGKPTKSVSELKRA